MIINATGDKAKHKGLINQVVITNNKLLIKTNTQADLGEIIPAGISRVAVRGFSISISLSKYLLNAIAALRANTIHNNTSINDCQLKPLLSFLAARKYPSTAKGNANTV